MPKFAAFLRAVNLGPTRKISSADLRSLFEELGFENVATFRTSGNVVFAAGRESPEKLTARIQKAIGAALGDEVPIFLRTEKEIRALAAHEPFPPKLVVFGDRELYWLPSGGIRDSGLNFRSLEQLLGSTTTRTKGTIDQLAAKYF